MSMYMRIVAFGPQPVRRRSRRVGGGVKPTAQRRVCFVWAAFFSGKHTKAETNSPLAEHLRNYMVPSNGNSYNLTHTKYCVVILTRK